MFWASEVMSSGCENMNQALQEELLSMQARDQICRTAVTIKTNLGVNVTEKELRQLEFVDRVNTYRMQEIVLQHGWPGRSLVGEEGTAASLLLVLHADRNMGFQKDCLKLLSIAVLCSEAPAKDLAFLTDRILVNEGKPQRYGTQFSIFAEHFTLAEIENLDTVNAHRQALGLCALFPAASLWK